MDKTVTGPLPPESERTTTRTVEVETDFSWTCEKCGLKVWATPTSFARRRDPRDARAIDAAHRRIAVAMYGAHYGLDDESSERRFDALPYGEGTFWYAQAETDPVGADCTEQVRLVGQAEAARHAVLQRWVFRVDRGLFPPDWSVYCYNFHGRRGAIELSKRRSSSRGAQMRSLLVSRVVELGHAEVSKLSTDRLRRIVEILEEV